MWWYIRIGTCMVRDTPSGVGPGVTVAVGVGVGDAVGMVVAVDILDGVAVRRGMVGRVMVGVRLFWNPVAATSDTVGVSIASRAVT